MQDIRHEFGKMAHAESLLPREEMLEVGRQKSRLSIGVPKETSFQENRVMLIPDGVRLLVHHGHRILVETGAGKGAKYEDHEYSEAGALVVYSPEEVFQADLILKVSPVTLKEIEYLRQKQAMISALQLGLQHEEFFRRLMAKRMTALAFDYIRDETNTFPVIRSMSEIAGNMSVIIAAEYLSHPQFGKGSMFGGFTGIHPTEVLILGAGTVGEYAARAAMGLGAFVKVFDNSIYRLRRLQNNLPTRIYTSTLNPKILSEAMKTADVVIGAVHAIEGKTPCMISEHMVMGMKEGSVIIDVSIDQGGCFETSVATTHSNPVFLKHGVTHYCVPNIPSKVPQTASAALNNLFVPLILKAGEEGGIENMLKTDYGARQGVYLYNGVLTKSQVGEMFGIPFQNLDLLIAAIH